MRRILIARFAPLLLVALGSAAPAPSQRGMPDVVEAGRVAATLSDWQTIAYFLVFLVVAGTIERMAAAWHARATANRLALAIEKLGLAVSAQGTELKVMLTVIQLKLGGERQE